MQFLVAVFVLIAAAASASEPQVIVIQRAMVREVPQIGGITAGYLTIKNTGLGADRLVAVRTDAAMQVEIHEMSMTDGVMMMRELEGGLPIAPGETVTLAPRGLHLMIMETKFDLPQGTEVPMILEFENAGDVHVKFTAQPLGEILKKQ